MSNATVAAHSDSQLKTFATAAHAQSDRTFLDHCGIAAQTAMEWSVARVSATASAHL